MPECSKVVNQMERDFDLLGITAVEDKIQIGVPETVGTFNFWLYNSLWKNGQSMSAIHCGIWTWGLLISVCEGSWKIPPHSSADCHMSHTSHTNHASHTSQTIGTGEDASCRRNQGLDAHWPLVGGSSLCIHKHLERANIHETSQQQILPSNLQPIITEGERERDLERKIFGWQWKLQRSEIKELLNGPLVVRHLRL